VERDNPSLKGVLPKDYARPALDKQRLGQLIDLITNIPVGSADARSRATWRLVNHDVRGDRTPLSNTPLSRCGDNNRTNSYVQTLQGGL